MDWYVTGVPDGRARSSQPSHRHGVFQHLNQEPVHETCASCGVVSSLDVPPSARGDLGPPDRYVERPPVVVEREQIIERRYVPPPVYRERRVTRSPSMSNRCMSLHGYIAYGYAYGYGRGWHPGRFHGGRWGHYHRRW